MEKEKIIAVAIAVTILSGVIMWQFSERLRPYTLLSVSEIKVEPQGYEGADGEWKGSFWSILMTTDFTDTVGAYKFDESEAEKGDDTVDGEKLVPQSSIEIKIDPHQPYYERPLEIKSTTVTPKTYGAWANMWGQWGKKKDVSIDPVYSGHYEFGTGDWTLHTPFTVTVLKNGVSIGSETIDTVGGVQTVKIGSGSEYVTITDLGKLGTGYGEPQIGNVLYFADDAIFKADTYARNLIKYDGTGSLEEMEGWGDDIYRSTGESFSVYWFGDARWGTYGDDDKSPCGFTYWDRMTPELYKEDELGGWGYLSDWSRKPIAPPILVGDKADLPDVKNDDKSRYKCLTEYLSYKGVKDVTYPSWLSKREVTDDLKMRLYLPFSSANSLIKIQISTELADTIVWQPQVANIKIISFPDLGDISDRKTSYVEVKQESTVASAGTIWLTVDPATAPLSVNPITIGTGTMQPGETKKIPYEILNLGWSEETKLDCTITAEVTNSLGDVTDTATATFSLLQKGVGETTLTVYTLDKETLEYVSGITVTATYDSESKSGITSDGSISWSFGAVQPSVTVTSAETAKYQSASETELLTAGPNSITLELVKHGEEAPWWEEYWWVIVLAIAVVIVIILIVVYKKWW